MAIIVSKSTQTDEKEQSSNNNSSSSTTKMGGIFTAIIDLTHKTFEDEEEDDVQSMITQPLLTLQDDDEDDDDVLVVKNKSSSSSSSDDDEDSSNSLPSSCHGRFVALGCITGFFIQVVSLGAYALMLMHYRDTMMNKNSNTDATDAATPSSDTAAMLDAFTNGNAINAPPTSGDLADWFYYGMLSVLTQVDLVIYVLIWVAFTCTMTKGGMQFIRLQVSNAAGAAATSSNKDASTSNSGIKRRAIFLLGVYFLVGIVLGAFCAWSMIDVYLGFPIPFMPIVATVGIDLILCYMMVWCYDLGRTRKSEADESVECDSDDDDDEEECICC